MMLDPQDPAQQAATLDAVVIVPGIFGTILTEGDRILWGGASPDWYAKAWGSARSPLDDLVLTKDEHAGNYGRVTPTGLITTSAYSPIFGGFDSYSSLSTAIVRVVANPAAVLEFAYDWRLPAAHNARLLEAQSRAHLARWRAHPQCEAYRREWLAREPKLVFVAHSTGGLLVRALSDNLEIRTIILLGTPLNGAPEAALAINFDREYSPPRPRTRLGRLARTFPALYELLPTYPCIHNGQRSSYPRRITPDDIRAFGGDPDLAASALAFHQTIATRPLRGLHAIIGTGQPTIGALAYADGIVRSDYNTFSMRGDDFERDVRGDLVRRPCSGDGVVPAISASIGSVLPVAVSQRHGFLVSDADVISAVCTTISLAGGVVEAADRSSDPSHPIQIMGEPDLNSGSTTNDGIGFDLPDILNTGAEVSLSINGPTSVAHVAIWVKDEAGNTVDRPQLKWIKGRYEAIIRAPQPGIYKVAVTRAASTPIIQLVLAIEPAIEIFPMAIGEFDHHPDLDVEIEVGRLARLLADFGGAVVRPWHKPMPERGADAVTARLREWSGVPGGPTILYWVGHGWSDGRSAALAHAFSPPNIGSDGIRPEALADAITVWEARTSREDAWLIVVIDACQSARYAELLAAALDDRQGARRSIIFGTSSRGATTLGGFTSALETTIRRTFAANREIAVTSLATELSRTIPGSTVRILNVDGGDVLRRTIPLPTFVGPLDAGKSTSDLSVVLNDVPEHDWWHFLSKAQGGGLPLNDESMPGAGWYFTGRETERQHILDWLATSEGVFIVSGPAGSGKSALLGDVLIRSCPPLTNMLVASGLLPPLSRDAPAPFDCAVQLTGMTAADFIATACRALELSGPDEYQPLADQLEILIESIEASRPPRLLADALDEAVEPWQVAEVLRRLANVPGAQVIVSTRPTIFEGAQTSTANKSSLIDILGTSAHIVLEPEDEALVRYVARRLSVVGMRVAVEHVARAIAESAHHFLYANLAVLEVLKQPELFNSSESIYNLLGRDPSSIIEAALERLFARNSSYQPLLVGLALAQGKGVPTRDGVWLALATAASGEIIDTDALAKLLDDAAAYIITDTDRGQPVYRLGYSVFAERLTASAEVLRKQHEAIAQLSAVELKKPACNQYWTRYASNHIIASGRSDLETHLVLIHEMVEEFGIDRVASVARLAKEGWSLDQFTLAAREQNMLDVSSIVGRIAGRSEFLASLRSWGLSVSLELGNIGACRSYLQPHGSAGPSHALAGSAELSAFYRESIGNRELAWIGRLWAAIAAKSSRCVFERKPTAVLRPPSTPRPNDVVPVEEESPRSAAAVVSAPQNRLNSPLVTGRDPQVSGAILEEGLLDVLAALFKVRKQDGDGIVSRLRRQRSGSQLGHDFELNLEFIAESVGTSEAKCHVECKNYGQTLQLSHIADKLLQSEYYHSESGFDHWVVISPRSDCSNELNSMIATWNETERFEFTIHVCSPETGAKALFAAQPVVFRSIYGAEEQLPTPDEIMRVQEYWRDRLKPPRIRLPRNVRLYLMNAGAHCLPGEPREHFEELADDCLNLRATDDGGVRLPGTLDTNVHSWLEAVAASRVLLLLGEFGDGKSFFSYRLSREMNGQRARGSAAAPVTIRLALRDLRNAGNPQDLLGRRLRELGISFDEWVAVSRQSPTLIILDGFDEMSLKLDPETLSGNIARLAECYEYFSDSRLIVTSRTHFFESSRDRYRFLDMLSQPRVLRISPVPREERVRSLANFASRRSLNEQFHRICRLYDPIGLSKKALFFQMIREVLEDLPEDDFNEVILYDLYIEKSIRRKINDLQDAVGGHLSDELIGSVRELLADVASALHFAGSPYLELRTFDSSRGEIKSILWRMTQADDRAESDSNERDARSRLGIRSLLKPVLTVDQSNWPVEFFHRSMHEYFVACALLQRLEEDARVGAVKLLDAATLGPEVVGFLVNIAGSRSANPALGNALVGLARSATIGSEAKSLGGNAITLAARLGVDLRRFDWSNLVLDYAELNGADLSDTSFRGSSLTYAVLDNATLRRTNFSNADLTGVRLEETAAVAAVCSASAERFYAAYSDGSVRMWEQRGGSHFEWYGVATELDEINHLCVTPDGNLLVFHGRFASLVLVPSIPATNPPRVAATFQLHSRVRWVDATEEAVLVVAESGLQREIFLASFEDGSIMRLEHGDADSIGAVSEDKFSYTMGSSVILGPNSSLPVPGVSSIDTLSSDGCLLLAVGNESGQVIVAECGGSEPDAIGIQDLGGYAKHDGPVTSVAMLSRDMIVSGGVDRSVVVMQGPSPYHEVARLELSLDCAGVICDGVVGELEQSRLRDLGTRSPTSPPARMGRRSPQRS